MKNLELNQMEALEGAQSGRSCLIIGAATLGSLIACPFTAYGGCYLAAALFAGAGLEGCFNS